MTWECMNCKHRAFAYHGERTISVCTAFNYASNGFAFREVEPPITVDEWKCPNKDPYKKESYPFPYIQQIGNLLYCTETCDIVDGFGNPLDYYDDEEAESDG